MSRRPTDVLVVITTTGVEKEGAERHVARYLEGKLGPSMAMDKARGIDSWHILRYGLDDDPDNTYPSIIKRLLKWWATAPHRPYDRWDKSARKTLTMRIEGTVPDVDVP